MKNPQTLASQLYDTFQIKDFEPIAKYGCCAFTLLWIIGYKDSDSLAIKTLMDMIKNKKIGKNCMVYWYEAYKYLTGKTLKNVKFITVKNPEELKIYEGRIAVKYKYKNKEHWVGYLNGKLCFNSLEYSQCVENGRPVEVRVLEV